MKKWERVRGVSTVLGCAGCWSVVEGVDPEGRREDGEGGRPPSKGGREGGGIPASLHVLWRGPQNALGRERHPAAISTPRAIYTQ